MKIEIAELVTKLRYDAHYVRAHRWGDIVDPSALDAAADHLTELNRWSSHALDVVKAVAAGGADRTGIDMQAAMLVQTYPGDES